MIDLLRNCFRGMLFICPLIFSCFGCGWVPEKVSPSSPRIKPMLQAMAEVDRAALGFTPIPTNADIRLELSSRGTYDAMLHIYASTSRTIAFRKTQQGYRWISEQEIHKGPKWQQTVDGNFREQIVVEYQTERVNGISNNQLHIRYSGDDPEINRIGDLTLMEANAIIERWKSVTVEPEPPLLPGEGFNPALLMILLMFLVACCIVLLLVAVCACIGAALLAFGIVSTSILTALLQRSVSSGFRALFLQVGAVCGLLLGIVLPWLAGSLINLSWNHPTRTVLNAAVGLASGLLLSWVFNMVWTQIAAWLSMKLKNRSP